MENNKIHANYVKSLIKLGFKPWNVSSIDDKYPICYELILPNNEITIYYASGKTTLGAGPLNMVFATDYIHSLKKLKEFLKTNNINI